MQRFSNMKQASFDEVIGNHIRISDSELEKDCLDVLKIRNSTITALHPHQLTAIRELLDGNSVIQHVQTGGGKTLVIILLALLQLDYPRKYDRQKILVFSPTVALIQDTKRRFEAFGISCWAYDSSKKRTQHSFPVSRSCVISEADLPTSRKIEDATVIFLTTGFWISTSSKAQSVRDVFAAAEHKIMWIDEAETAIMTSKSYRPTQFHLGNICRNHAETPKLFSSATWTENLLEEGGRFYGFANAKLVKTPADRRNLNVMRLDATTMDEAKEIVCNQVDVLLRTVAQCPTERKDQAIVFVRSHSDVDSMVKKLKTMMPAACKLISGFHAEMPHKI